MTHISGVSRGWRQSECAIHSSQHQAKHAYLCSDLTPVEKKKRIFHSSGFYRCKPEAKDITPTIAGRRPQAWNEAVPTSDSFKGQERSIANQTNTETSSKATFQETFEKRGRMHKCFSERLDTIYLDRSWISIDLTCASAVTNCLVVM